MDFKQPYNRENYLKFFRGFLPDDFETGHEELDLEVNFQFVSKISKLGECASLDLKIYEVRHSSENDPRVSLSKEAFRLAKKYNSRRAIIVFTSKKSQNYRLSLITFETSWESGKKIKVEFSNPRRYSFFLGPEAKTRTPERFLLEKGKIKSFEDLLSRFSVEVVNKDFYREIARYFNRLVGGDVKLASKTEHFKPEMVLPYIDKADKKTYQEFAVRLIGRIIFCWFLKQKKSVNGVSLLPDEYLSVKAVDDNSSYYHQMLEKIFFEVLNNPVSQRKPELRNGYEKIPYLNGGLFDPQHDDFYDCQPNWGLKIPDQWFRDLFAMLETYNFTIDENTVIDVDLSIDPEMLGRIFENLLAEINPETGESARKSTGSYYTPRPIVEYMVDQSLAQYLLTKTGIEENKIKALITVDDVDDEEYPLSEQEKKRALEALDEVRIIDPACGSGAFPIGILQKIVFILGRIDQNGKLWFEKKTENLDSLLKEDFKKKFENENFDYIRKTGVIRDSIYGVDIQPIAVEVSKLRCFLTLIVDEDIHDEAENRGIKPLPNLEFKFVAANTLFNLPGSASSTQQTAMFEEDAEIEKLKKLRDQYFVSSGQEKDLIKYKFKDIQREMFKKQIAKSGQGKMTMALADWDPFSNKSSSWFDTEWMFGVNDFDIVIANPPYVGHKGGLKKFFQAVKKTPLGKRFNNERMDIFYYFFHLAIDIGHDNAAIAFITTNYYPTADSAIKLRTDFKERTCIRKLINFNEFKIFESASGQHNIITILNKTKNKNALCEVINTKRTGVASPKLLQKIVNGQDEQSTCYLMSQDELYEGQMNYIRVFKDVANGSENIIENILNKLKHGSKSLSEICNISQGIVTGLDKVSKKHLKKFPDLNLKEGKGCYVLNDLEKATLEEDGEILRPWFKNSDISRYYTAKNNRYWLIHAHTDLDVVKHKKIFNHLSRFEKIIKSRNFDSGELSKAKRLGKWWALSSARKEFDFSVPKIVAPQRSKSNTFGYSEDPWYASADVYFITEKDTKHSLKFILGLLNSKLYYLWLYNKGKRKGETLELYLTPLSEIPIKDVSSANQKPIVNMVEKILEITQSPNYLEDDSSREKVHQLETQIDCLVYKLYSLTDDEVKTVEQSINGSN